MPQKVNDWLKYSAYILFILGCLSGFFVWIHTNISEHEKRITRIETKDEQNTKDHRTVFEKLDKIMDKLIRIDENIKLKDNLSRKNIDNTVGKQFVRDAANQGY